MKPETLTKLLLIPFTPLLLVACAALTPAEMEVIEEVAEDGLVYTIEDLDRHLEAEQSIPTD